jgi:hypothetical protein
VFLNKLGFDLWKYLIEFLNNMNKNDWVCEWNTFGEHVYLRSCQYATGMERFIEWSALLSR